MTVGPSRSLRAFAFATLGAIVACSSTPSDSEDGVGSIPAGDLDFNEARDVRWDEAFGCITLLEDTRLVVAHGGFQGGGEYDPDTWPPDLVITDIEASSASGADLEKLVILGPSADIGPTASLDELIDEGYETASLPYKATSSMFMPAVITDVTADGPANPHGPLVELKAMMYTFGGNTYRYEIPLSLWITRLEHDDTAYCAEFPG